MIRKIIKIDEELCDGCGKCARACHEGAIEIIDGKAKLISDSYCDGLGDCIGECPQGAITIIEREADTYDEQAVKANMKKKSHLACGCPGEALRNIEKKSNNKYSENNSALTHWPIQINLLPVNAPFFDNANLLIAADCTGFASPNFHRDFIDGKILMMGCPKLDDGSAYLDKLTEIFKRNNILSVTVTRMTVPCCGGMPLIVSKAIKNSGKDVKLDIVTIDVDGKVVRRE